MAALASGDVTLTGSARLQERPLGPVLAALRALGVESTCHRDEGFAPVTMHGGGLDGGHVTFGDLDSSQYVSSVLLAAPCARGDVTVSLAGQRVSEPYIGMTVAVMRAFGAQVAVKGEATFVVCGGEGYRATDYTVEADASSASYLLLAAALTGRAVTVTGLAASSLQGDIGFLEILRDVGCTVRVDERGVTVSREGPLAAGDRTYDLGAMPDMVPTVAVLAAVRPGVTTIRGVAHLRIKESDRLAAMVTELQRVGIPASEREDGFAITGGVPRGAEIATYRDHRIAMGFGILGLVTGGMRIADPGCVAKSYPDFWATLAQLGEPHNIVLVGARCAGKSEVAARLAARLGLAFVDTDAEIARRAGCSVKDLVSARGWPAFRAAEREAIASLEGRRATVIALGGGAVLDRANLAALKPHATVVWLDCEPAELARRLQSDPASVTLRPSLTDTDPVAEITTVLAERRPLYAAAADVTLDVTARSLDDIVAEIAARERERGLRGLVG